MKIKGIYLIGDYPNPESMIKGVKGKPILLENKKVGEMISAKINREGNLEWEGIITDESITQDMSKGSSIGIKILGEENETNKK